MAKYKKTVPNRKRAKWVRRALEQFCLDVGQDLKVEASDAVGDFLANLMHWCAQNNVDFEVCLRNGQTHFADESAGR